MERPIQMHLESGAKKRWLNGVSRYALALGVSTAVILSVPTARAADPNAPANPEQVAQASPAESGHLEEVTVTARHREENLQQTPISITALSGDDLEKKGLETIDDVGKNVPNLTIYPNEAQFGNSASVYIRGIGQYDFDFAFDPGVAIYIDDVYYGTLYGNQFDLTDTDSVQVLRGPQGTLFGRNTEGGAVLINTVKPKGDYSGYAEAGYGSYNHEQFKGAFDIPLIQDQLAMRISTGLDKVDGYVDVKDFGCADPAGLAQVNAEITAYNAGPFANIFGKSPLLPRATTTINNCTLGKLGGGNTQNYHGSLLWTPNTDLSVQLSGDLLDIHNEAPATITNYINPNYPGSLVGIAVPGYGSIFETGSHYTTFMGTQDLKTGLVFPQTDDTFSWGFSGDINYKTPWGFDIKDILAYRYYDGNFGVWAGGSPLAVDNTNNIVSHHQFSEELQLLGTTDYLFGRPLDWAAGAYYFTAYSKYEATVDLPPLNFLFNQDDPIIDHNTSGFVHGVYHITDDFSTEIGVRYSTEDKSYSYSRQNPYTGGPTNVEPFEHYGPLTSSSSRFDPKVEFDYHLTPDLMTYASVSTGYKGGGVNPRPVSVAAILPFKQEDLEAAEFGTKTQWFDNRLRFNADVFGEDFKDLQTPYVPPIGPLAGGTIIVNTGHVLLYGTEMQLDATPFPGFNIDASAGWLHYKTLSLGAEVANEVNPPLEGEKPGGIPSWKTNLGMQYSIDLPDQIGTLTPRVDGYYQSDVYFGNQHPYTQLTLGGPKIPVPIIGKQDAYATLDARVSFDSADGNWTAALQAHNVTNTYYIVNAFSALLSLYGNNDVTPSMPRTFFFTIKRNFQAATPLAAYTAPPAPPAPAPAPAPAAQPEAQREFQVFFDFDKSNITDAAARVIQSAADVVKAGGIAHITVTGHTDTVGTAKYNQGLSERRADSVKSQLTSDGVSGGEITTVGVGKSGLLVPTKDGVREPQNRRAVIELQ